MTAEVGQVEEREERGRDGEEGCYGGGLVDGGDDASYGLEEDLCIWTSFSFF